jgi:hypothetical protein
VRSLGVFGAFFVLAILATWPWAARLGDAVPDVVDTYEAAWRLFWGFHQTFHDPLRLFDGNVFYPHRDTLAFSETLYGISVPLFPLFAAGVTPLAAYGAAVLIGFALSGGAAYRLARTLGAPLAAAWVAGLGFAFAPYRLGQLNHVGSVWAFGLPLALEALVLFVRARTFTRAAWLAATLVVLGLTWATWLLLAAVPLALTAACLAVRERARAAPAGGGARGRPPPPPRLWLGAGAAVLVASAALSPFLLAYGRVARAQGFVRTAEEATFFSGRPSNWLDVSENNRFWTALRPARMSGERRLCPGVFLLALAAAGIAAGLSREASPAVRALALTGAVWAVLGFLGSLGLHTPFHRVLWEYVPVFRGMRVPMRWAMVGLLGLALLASAAVARLGRSRAIAGAFACALLLVEQRAWPLALARGAPDPSPLARRLAAMPMRGGVAELPARQPALALYVLRAADHLRPLIDGSSSYEPESSRLVRELSSERPVPAALMDHLEALRASYVVLHEDLCTEEERAALRRFLDDETAAGRLRQMERLPPADTVWAVARTEP